ncbi:unnamed protein product [Symbiodinium sp. CCMP2592]|nr:unnamed protein product [Symbiodinium sp. CCMP2592]
MGAAGGGLLGFAASEAPGCPARATTPRKPAGWPRGLDQRRRRGRRRGGMDQRRRRGGGAGGAAAALCRQRAVVPQRHNAARRWQHLGPPCRPRGFANPSGLLSEMIPRMIEAGPDIFGVKCSHRRGTGFRVHPLICKAAELRKKAAHRLDRVMGNIAWHVGPVSDSDAVFEATGVKPHDSQVAGNKKKTATLIKFGAENPKYAEECKEPSHPGSEEFDRNKMNQIAEALDDENPCKNVYAEAPADPVSAVADAVGLGFWNAIAGEPSSPGVTYKDVIECSDDDWARELEQEEDEQDFHLPTVKSTMESVAAALPNAETAPLGLGAELKPGDTMEEAGGLAMTVKDMANEAKEKLAQLTGVKAEVAACDPLQLGFARSFCDLHCIRDAVRKGDDAILRALEHALSVVGQNTQLLLEHYALRFFDSTWRTVRRHLDDYLQASQEHVKATRAASNMLQSYTTTCRAGFRQLKESYATFVRARKSAACTQFLESSLQRPWQQRSSSARWPAASSLHAPSTSSAVPFRSPTMIACLRPRRVWPHLSGLGRHHDVRRLGRAAQELRLLHVWKKSSDVLGSGN